MSYGPMQVFTATMASAAATATFEKLSVGYSKIHFVLPSLSTNAEASTSSINRRRYLLRGKNGY